MQKITQDNILSFIDHTITKQYSRGIARGNLAFPICVQDEKLYIASASDNQNALRQIIKSLNFEGEYENITLNSDLILKAISQIYNANKEIENMVENIVTSSTSDGEVIRLTNLIIEEAIVSRTSDIHFEPEQDSVRIRYRIDGRLIKKYTLPLKVWSMVSNRIKVLSGMNLAVHKKPCDGRFMFPLHNDHEVDIRVSSQLVIWGENFVLRILGDKNKFIDFNNLGFSSHLNTKIKEYANKSAGLFVVSGPVGSGKTSTLYAILSMLKDESINIVTLEDPVEYQFNLIRQTQVNDLGGLSFAEGIRSLLRQDPDVILIGEIRDEESAATAIRSAMLGHLVFTTVHAKNVEGSFNRLMALGVDKSAINDNVICTMTQRLVRKVCRNCVSFTSFNQEELDLFAKYNLNDFDPYKKAIPNGCSKCWGCGFSERQVIGEIMSPEQWQSGIYNFQSIAKDGLFYVSRGVTSLNELSSVIDL